MKAKIFFAGLLFAVIFLVSLSYSQVPQMINYQGTLFDDAGNPINDPHDMTFSIYDVPTEGTALWTETQNGVPVENGIFNVLLGSVNPIAFDVFNGDIRYLGVQVDEDEEMTPRREIVSVAYAYRAQMGDNDWTFRITDGADTTLITGGEWGIARSGNVLHGNADSTHVNLGIACTTGTSGQTRKYCTVGGGSYNTASTYNTTVGGGVSNTASGPGATVGGGGSNIASGYRATVGGGYGNNASGERSTVGGGDYNTASNWYTTVGGGYNNIANGNEATVSGGWSNTASGLRATVGGGGNNAAGDSFATVGGGEFNTTYNSFATVGGGYSNNTLGDYSTIGGGFDNTASGSKATVGGGALNTASGLGSTVGGGGSNTASGMSSAVGGGAGNTASGDFSTVCGGMENLVQGFSSAILGGWADTVTATADFSYLFGIGSKLTEDSTFMVDMPHIRFGDEANGYEFPPSDGSSGQVMATNGSGQLSWVNVSGGGGGWLDDGTVVKLETSTDSVGIGTNDPQYKLDVNGDAHISGLLKIGDNTLWLDPDFHRIMSTDNVSVIIDSDADQTDRVFSVSRDEPVGDPGSGIELFRVQENGNVGIGTNSPTEALDVNGTVQMSGFKMPTDATDGYVLTSDASGVGTWQEAVGGIGGSGAAGYIPIFTAPTTIGNSVIHQLGSRVGINIGATLPNAALQVNGAISRQNTVLWGANAATATHVNLGVACTTGTEDWNYQYCTVGGGAANASYGGATTVGGGTGNTASGVWATVGGGSLNTASGWYATVGGGVFNTASGDSATVGGGRLNTASGLAATVPGGDADTAAGDYSLAAGRQVRITEDADHTFAFGRDFTTSTPNAVIFHNSVDDIKVGIGTESPEAMLHVAGTIQGKDAFYFDQNSDLGYSNAVIGFDYSDTANCDRRLRVTAGRDDTGDNREGACIDLHGNECPLPPYQKNGDLDLVAGLGVPGARGDITFWTGDSDTARMVIENSGRVGIGTADPTTLLHVYQSNTSNDIARFMSNTSGDDDAGGILVSADASNSLSGDAGAATFWAKASENGGHATGVSSYVMAEGVDIACAFYGHATLGNTASFEYAFYGDGDGYFSGYLYKAGGGFKIDHPLDPENKYLYHSFVESPDMMNVYNGNVMLDVSGEATVELPDYFEVVNKDFRYQLTCIGGFAPVYIAEEISDNRFKLAGGKPGMKVSWQVTGIRKDPFAEANRIQVEVDKPADERGKYMHPEAYGLGKEYGIHYEEYKRMQEQLQEKSDQKME